MNLQIIHTNDLHSNFKNFAKITSKIKKIRKGKNAILLDAGDFADFKSIELQGTNGYAAVELLESAGYDAITVGNNETFNWIDTLEFMATSSKVPFLSCNLFNKGNDQIKGVKSSVILNKNGIRTLIIGTSPDLGPFNELMGFTIRDYKKMIKEEMEKQKHKYDICILVNHISSDLDEELAKELEGIDIIISAHDHKLFDEAKLVNNTIINSAGAYGEYIGIIEIEYIDNKIKLKNSETIKVEDMEEDTSILEILKFNKQKAIKNLSKPLFNIDFTMWHDVIEENPISNLIADGLKDMFKCDIGIINSGIVNGGVIKGNVSDKKLIEICPSPLNPTYFEVQGKYLKEAIESSLNVDFCMQDGQGPGFRGRYLGRLHVSGAIIKYSSNKVTEILINNEKLDEEKWYAVASSDYLQRGTGYKSLANNKNEEYRAEYIRDVLRIYLNKEDFVERAFLNRWIGAK